MQNGATAKLARTAAAIYWVVAPTSIFTFEFWRTAPQITNIDHKNQRYDWFRAYRCRNIANRNQTNQRYDWFSAYRCRNRANRNVDCKYKKNIHISFYICNQRYDLLYFCSGRPKIDRNVDCYGYDLFYFCSGRPETDRNVDLYAEICRISQKCTNNQLRSYFWIYHLITISGINEMRGSKFDWWQRQ